jgi:hypothetical protein
MATRASIAALLAPDLRKVYLEVGKDRPPEYPLVLNVSDMPYNPVTDQQVSGLGTMPGKPERTSFNLDDIIMGGQKDYSANPYGLAVEISWEAWRDELYGILQEMVRCLARAGRNREETAAWSVFNNAFSSSYTGFTSSEELCTTTHTGLDGASRANRPSPDIGFSITYIQNAITRFASMTDERGLPRLMAPTTHIIGSTNLFAAREVYGSAGKPYTTDNEINAIIEEDLSYMVCHYLTTSTYHFLVASKGIHDLHFMWRDHPIFDVFDDPYTKDAIATAYQRHTNGEFGSWRGVDGSTG